MATPAEKLAQAIATYNRNVSNQESSTIISRSKAAVDAAQKAYDNQPAAPTGPNDAQNRARLEAEAKAAAKAKAKTDPTYVAAKANQTAAAAEVTATQKSIADAKAALDATKATNAANKLANDEAAAAAKLASDAAAAAKAEQAARDATSAALLADQKKQTEETAAALAAAQEELRLANLEKAEADRLKAESDAAAAKTSEELAAAQAAIEAANAQTIAAQEAAAEAIAAAEANINQSGNAAIPTMSLADTASDMYAKELAAKEAADTAMAKRVSISDIMTARFKEYKLESLALKIRDLAINGASEDTITLALQETDEYKTRFAANEARKTNNLRVLSPGEYLSNEDAYRKTLRAYGLTQFDTDKNVEQYIANDTSPEELSARVSAAVDRLKNADPMVMKTLKDYYKLGDTDILAYVLDTKNQLPEILRKVTAAEIGTAATSQGLKSSMESANALAEQGVTQAEAKKGYADIAYVLPTADKLSEIYGGTVEKYGQTQAEQEAFLGLASAKRKREKLSATEIAQFQGSSGMNKTSLTSSIKGAI